MSKIEILDTITQEINDIFEKTETTTPAPVGITIEYNEEKPATQMSLDIIETEKMVIEEKQSKKKTTKKNIEYTQEESVRKLKMIAEEMNKIFFEREEVISALILTILTKSNMLMLGEAGTGKSLLAHEFCKRVIEGKYFQWLLNKTSDPSEIFGPYSIKSMENDEFKRITTGKLPEAHLAFLDEVILRPTYSVSCSTKIS